MIRSYARPEYCCSFQSGVLACPLVTPEAAGWSSCSCVASHQLQALHRAQSGRVRCAFGRELKGLWDSERPLKRSHYLVCFTRYAQESVAGSCNTSVSACSITVQCTIARFYLFVAGGIVPSLPANTGQCLCTRGSVGVDTRSTSRRRHHLWCMPWPCRSWMLLAETKACGPRL